MVGSMGLDFRGTVRKVYAMGEQRALVLEDQYRGDLEPGEWIEVALPSGRKVPVRVQSLAWGSAFRADSPPLTLVVEGFDDELPEEGTSIRGIAAP